MSRKISPELANEIYDILVDVCGAPDRTRTTKSGKEYKPNRESFIREFSESDEPTREWRFCGSLGFGGKFWHNNKFCVSCYSEDENEVRRAAIDLANEKLMSIYDAYKDNQLEEL